MNRFVKVGCVIALVSLATFALARPERNSFVDYKVGTAHDLVLQVKTDWHVADRYMRHFGMTKPQLIDFLRGLHRAPLQKSGLYTIYSIPPDGHVKMHLARLEAGEPVFEDASGNPVLRAKCGNPLTLGPVSVITPNEVEAETSVPAGDTMKNLPDLETGLDVGTTEMALSTPATPDLNVLDTTPQTTTYAAAPATPGEVGKPGTFTAGPGSSPNLGLAIPFLGGIGWTLASHGGGNIRSQTPEPGTYLVMGFGAAFLLSRRRARKSR